jgi:hypothetical protein
MGSFLDQNPSGFKSNWLHVVIITLFRFITVLCGTDRQYSMEYSTHSVGMWGIFCIILSISQDVVKDLNNVIVGVFFIILGVYSHKFF